MRNTACILAGLSLLLGGCGSGENSPQLQPSGSTLLALQEPAQSAKNETKPIDDKTTPGPAFNQPAVAGPEAKPRPGKPGSDWPTFLGPTGDSKSTEKGILTKWPKSGPRVVWQREVGTGYGIGSVSQGRYFHFDKIDGQEGKDNETDGINERPRAKQGGRARLVCLEAHSGREIWTYTYPSDYEDLYGYDDGPRASPVVDGDRVYIYGVEGMLTCLQVKDGKKVWQVDVNQKFGVITNFFGVGSTPVIEGNLLIAMVGGSPEEDKEVPPGQLDRVTPNGSAIVAFDKKTGEVKYKIGKDLASYSSLKLATIGDRRWCFAFCRENLIGFEPATGKIDFEYPWRAKTLESVNAATPVVFGKHVFISETYGPGSSLLEVKPGGFEVKWTDEERRRDPAMQAHWTTPIYHEGYLYGCSGRHPYNAELRCIEAATGKVMWSEPKLTRCSLLYADGHLIVLSEYGRLMLVKADPQKFDLVAEAEMRVGNAPAAGDLESPDEPRPLMFQYPAWAAPVLSHGLLYVRGKGRVACLDLSKE